LLDRLLSRDGLTFDEACEVLRTRHGVKASREELEAYSRALPRRTARRRVAVEYLKTAPSPELSPEEAAMARENASRQAEVFSFLQEAVHSLPADEQLLFMHLVEGLSIAEIARAHKLDQKSLYRSRERILRSLREYLRDRGVRKDEMDSLF
jgi:DNA-directed RNA polymerase specialized sigma24 family protein